ncbi:hypothetical protein Vadar_009552 [Vaccinium darrowii]|uniref:Uncharacterized protein n=1 Tax=Vaccinium darrowii TaxID=229202 RepID=A0ACB7XZG0_9ERIC|nr:hypothetical protein Vadar_009552 [Vaccinium darrowii]
MVADRFQRSTSTISAHFKLMRRAICNLAPHIIRPPDLHVTPPEILNDDRHFPWFQDCVGAIDETQIEAWVPRNRQVASRGRKPTITQNVMAVCSFDMKFTYVYPGWEGSAHNGRVFNAAVSNPANNFPYPPINKYYVVDAGYTNMLGYLAPYRGRRYHKDEFNGTNTVFCTPMELFNYKHSSLRNVIEWCFGVLKGRGIDEFFEGFTDPFEWEGGNDNQGNAGNMVGVEPINVSPQNIQLMAQRREQMAFKCNYCH